MQTQIDIYNYYEQNITKMIYVRGYKDINYMILRLSGPFAVAKAFTEFFGYKYYGIINN